MAVEMAVGMVVVVAGSATARGARAGNGGSAVAPGRSAWTGHSCTIHRAGPYVLKGNRGGVAHQGGRIQEATLCVCFWTRPCPCSYVVLIIMCIGTRGICW
jgi:hypothetical protein